MTASLSQSHNSREGKDSRWDLRRRHAKSHPIHRRTVDGIGGRSAVATAMWTACGRIRYGCVNSWTSGLVRDARSPYGVLGANGGATRIVTGADTGGSARLDTRLTTRPGGGNVPGTGVSTGPSAGLSTGSTTGAGRGSSSVGAFSLSAPERQRTNRGDRRDPRD